MEVLLVRKPFENSRQIAEEVRSKTHNNLIARKISLEHLDQVFLETDLKGRRRNGFRWNSASVDMLAA